jgi:membrane protein YqaA with SNARE-associated domain
MFVWAAAEAVALPLIPEFLLIPLAAGNRRRFYLPLAASVAGMAVGGAAIYLFAYSAPVQAGAYLAQLPLLGHGVYRVQAQFSEHGGAAFVYQPLSGIPFKIWAVVAGARGISPLRAIPTFVIARGLRMTAFATLARVAAGLFTNSLRDYSLVVLAIYLAVFFLAWWKIVTS